MRRQITARLLACAVSQRVMVTGPALGNTVEIVHDGFGAYDAANVWGADPYGADVAAGVYTLNKTGDSGFPALNGETANKMAPEPLGVRPRRPRMGSAHRRGQRCPTLN